MNRGLFSCWSSGVMFCVGRLLSPAALLSHHARGCVSDLQIPHGESALGTAHPQPRGTTRVAGPEPGSVRISPSEAAEHACPGGLHGSNCVCVATASAQLAAPRVALWHNRHASVVFAVRAGVFGGVCIVRGLMMFVWWPGMGAAGTPESASKCSRPLMCTRSLFKGKSTCALT